MDPFSQKARNSRSPDETAGEILQWLANEPDMLGRFLALSGTDIAQLRNAVQDPDFLGGMIDFVMADEPTLMAFCAQSGVAPEAVAAAARHFTRPALDSGEW